MQIRKPTNLSLLLFGSYFLFSFFLISNTTQAATTCNFTFDKNYVELGGTLTARWNYSGDNIDETYISCNHEQAGQGLNFVRKNFFDIESQEYTWQGDQSIGSQKAITHKGQKQCKITLEDSNDQILCENIGTTYNYDPDNKPECNTGVGPYPPYCEENKNPIPGLWDIGSHFNTVCNLQNTVGTLPQPGTICSNQGDILCEANTGTVPRTRECIDPEDYTPPIDPINTQSIICSDPGIQNPFIIHFDNQSDEIVYVSWVNPDCDEIPSFSIQPNTIHSERTSQNHAFIVKDTNNQTLLQYKAPNSGNSETVKILNQSQIINENCSALGAQNPFYINFVNQTNEAVDIYWIDQTCLEQRYNTLPSKTSYVQVSFTNHMWFVKDVAGEILKKYKAPNSGTSETVNILDSDPSDLSNSILLSNKSLPENAGPNFFVGELSISDGSTGIFTFTSGAGDTHNDFFSILNGSTLVTKKSFDYEAGDTKSIRLSVPYDNENIETSMEIQIQDINENANRLEIQLENIHEALSIGSTIGYIKLATP